MSTIFRHTMSFNNGVGMQNAVLRQQIAHEEFDYQILLDRLKGYERPRDKISTLLKSGRSRSFNPPFGIFIYRRISVSAFQIGMDRVSLDHDISFLIATPEKALADKLVSERGTAIRTQK